MSRSWVTILVAAACAAPEVEGLPGQAGTPDVLGLQSTVAIAGEDFELTVSGGAPGELVAIARSLDGPGPAVCPPSLGGACLELIRPSELRRFTLGAGGVGSVTLRTDPAAGGMSWLQAARLSGPAGTSPVVPVRLYGPGDQDEDLLSDADEIRLGTPVDDPDADDDGALDGVEVARGMDPFNPDSDGDGIGDGEDWLPTTPQPPDNHVVDDVQVSAPGTSLPDPEFDSDSGRVAWQTWDGSQVWVADVDDVTGAFQPAHARGELVATGAMPISWGRNGVEWVTTATGSALVYTRSFGGVPEIVLAERGPTDWELTRVPGTEGARTPIGSGDFGDPGPRATFVVDLQPGWSSWWVDLADPTLSGQAPVFLRFPRWASSRRWLVGAAPAGPVKQAFAYHVDTDDLIQLTTTPQDKGSVFFWEAPELGGELVMFVTHARVPGYPDQIVTYREVGGDWTPVHRVEMPPAFPFVVSPEPLIWDGVSYVSYLATTGAENKDNGVSTVWVAGLLPGNDLVRRVSPGNGVVRKDPEPYTGGTRPWIYYSRVLQNGDRVIRRCELGL